MALGKTTLSAFAAAVLAGACATPEVPGTYETTAERHVSVTLNPSGNAVVSSATLKRKQQP